MIGPDNTTTQPYGIDTSVLVRLVRAEPELDFQHCVESLRALIDQDAEIFASNQVIGEAHIVLQHHYGISSEDARSALVDVLTGGIVAPLNGQTDSAPASIRDFRLCQELTEGPTGQVLAILRTVATGVQLPLAILCEYDGRFEAIWL